MSPVDASKVMLAVERMPSLPTTVIKVLEVANNPASTANDLNKVISLDTVLTAKVLKVVNSAYFGLNDQITSLVRAIVMLGLTTIKNLSISTAAMDALDVKGGAMNMDEFWKHTIGVGVMSKLIAKKMNVNQNLIENYFVAGLLHDIGKVVFNRYNPQGYKKLIDGCAERRLNLKDAEQALFGMDHAEVGGMLAEKWGFTRDLAQAIRWHHDPASSDEDQRALVEAVSFANTFVNAKDIGFSGNPYRPALPFALLEDLGLREESLGDIEEKLKAGIEKASVFIKAGN